MQCNSRSISSSIQYTLHNAAFNAVTRDVNTKTRPDSSDFQSTQLLILPIWVQRKEYYREGEEQLEEGDESLLAAGFVKNETPLITGVESGIE